MSEPEKKETPAQPSHPHHGHPVGIGIGVASGAATGAAIGAGVGGPIGAAIGAIAGGIVGGLTGQEVAQTIDPNAETAYWEENFRSRPYVEAGTFEDFGPAYRYAVETKSQFPGKTFEEVEPHLQAGWEAARGDSKLDWDHARHATQDAWYRLHRLSHLEVNERGHNVDPT
jgi:hypothetical protein